MILRKLRILWKFSMFNYDIDTGDINTEKLINDNRSLQILQDINKDFSDTLNILYEKINIMKDKKNTWNF